MNLLSIRSVNPAKCALALMDALFSDEEMGCKCFTCTSRSHKTPLPMDQVKLIEGMFNVYSKNPMYYSYISITYRLY